MPDLNILKENSNAGFFGGYASVFNCVDQHNDVILPNAFHNLEAHNVKLLWQHKNDQPIGIITLIKKDNYGLWIEGQISLYTTQGKDSYALIKMRAVSGISIGCQILDFYHNKNGVRIIKSLHLWEVSIVTFPANYKAQIEMLKRSNYS